MKRKENKEKDIALQKQIETINALYLQAKNWEIRLTKEEKHAIRKYTKNSLDNNFTKYKDKFFYILNKYLREKLEGIIKEENVSLERTSKIISSAIKKYELNIEVICYRGDSKNIFVKYKETSYEKSR